ncbi:hypothetical protein AUJ77_03485 [Candidatus Nomurabacteria bacterium CG1_02_43_90]|uniref:Uncharacterized protein n=1 Tax=Candidatus Nomurabacteria bacterium CG1_02_43_90 TaxID=1805281 RepID=A0A1J4V6S8_9BACT|nr:MAG: hypothetical protein AUJ77_03485 [Candidatus Nomurabacteria bacterium CG1_02_43_90]
MSYFFSEPRGRDKSNGFLVGVELYLDLHVPRKRTVKNIELAMNPVMANEIPAFPQRAMFCNLLHRLKNFSRKYDLIFGSRDPFSCFYRPRVYCLFLGALFAII